MHVTFLTHRLSQAGAGLHTAMLGLAGGLGHLGVEVSALGLDDQPDAGLERQWHPAQVLACPPFGPVALGYSRSLRAQLETAGPDVLHQHGLWTYSSMLGNHWGARHNQRRVISPHGMLDPWALKQGALRKKIALLAYERQGLIKAACLHALAPQEASSLRQLGLRQPICVIPNGVDLPAAQAKLKPQWQTRFGGQPYLLYLGRIHPKKNLTGLLDAWQSYLKSSPSQGQQWQLVVAGWGEQAHEQQLKDRIAMIDNGRCHFIGRAYGEDKAALYQHADGFVLPSFSEGLPMVVLEAWANHLPVLMTQHCNLPLGFERGAAIEIPTESTGMAPAIQTLLDASQSYRKTMGQAGRALVDERYGWPAVATQFATLYEWLAETRSDQQAPLPGRLDWVA